VGTKLKIAFAMDRHETIGQDLVNHCVNDIAVLGAEPLFFLDYIGTGKLEPRVFTEIVRGLVRACAQNRCALIGGETAQMPGFYAPGEYDVCGAIVGVAEKSRLLNGPKTVKAGDVVIGIASSGLHTNGYSLARKIFFEKMRLKPTSYVPELRGTIGDELLKVHVSYGSLAQALLKRFNPQTSAGNRRPGILALAHITGGGFVDNLPRVLPPNCDVVIRKGSWEILPIFQIIAKHGDVEEDELYQVFNMGVGLAAIISPPESDAALRFIWRQGWKAWIIGEVTPGVGKVRLL